MLALQGLVAYKALFIKVTDAGGQESGQGIVGPACDVWSLSWKGATAEGDLGWVI